MNLFWLVACNDDPEPLTTVLTGSHTEGMWVVAAAPRFWFTCVLLVAVIVIYFPQRKST